MRKMIGLFTASVVALVFIVSGCDNIIPPAATETEITAELQELQALIPMLEAGLTVATATETSMATASSTGRVGIKTVNAGAVLNGETPRELADDGTADADGWVRFPATASEFITDFYGTKGNEAEFYITPFDTNDVTTASIFQVRLYIYPTFSTTINYVLEEYLVDADLSSWALVDDTGTADPLYYLTNRTVYFDGTVEEHKVVSNSISTGTYYDVLFNDDTESNYLDLTSTLYEFPNDGGASSEPAAYNGADAVYSAHVISTIADTGITVQEYYTETLDANGDLVKSAVSFVTKNYVSGRLTENAKTVRRYIEYADGTKIVRASTDSSVGFSRISTVESQVTEVIDITPDNGSGLAEFSSTTTSTKNGETAYTTEVTLTETAADTGNYEGVSTHTAADGTTESYTVTLDDPTDGTGSMTVGGEETSVYYPVSRRTVKDIVADLKNGGTFSGVLKGNVIAGIYKALRSDETSSIEAALSYIYAVTGTIVSLN